MGKIMDSISLLEQGIFEMIKPAFPTRTAGTTELPPLIV